MGKKKKKKAMAVKWIILVEKSFFFVFLTAGREGSVHPTG